VDSPSKREKPKARKSSKNAARTHRQLHALLGKPDERRTRQLKKDNAANLTEFYTSLNL